MSTGVRAGLRRGAVLVAVALAAVLLVAGVLSGFASSSPDGLERVAEDQGFAGQAQEQDALGPLDGYALDGDDSRVGTGIAGVSGAVLVLVLAGGLTWLLRRRGSTEVDRAADGTADGTDDATGAPGDRVDDPSRAR